MQMTATHFLYAYEQGSFLRKTFAVCCVYQRALYWALRERFFLSIDVTFVGFMVYSIGENMNFKAFLIMR